VPPKIIIPEIFIITLNWREEKISNKQNKQRR